MQNQEFTGKVVLITGASSGFGKGAALAFAQKGASLVLAARRRHLLEGLVRDCETLGVKALAVPTDVSQEAEMARLAQTALETFARVDVWINDAGVGVLGRFDEIPLADHAQVIGTNLLGTIYGSAFALRMFRLQKSGTLINIASALGKIPAPYYASYTASKFGIVGLDASLRQELSECGEKDIHVCTVCPMAMDTPFFEHAGNYTGHEAQPVPPLYEPELVVDTIVELARHPRDEVIVGGRGAMMSALHSVAPGLVEKMMATQTHQVQIEKSPPAPESEGIIHTPSNQGTTLKAGLKKAS